MKFTRPQIERIAREFWLGTPETCRHNYDIMYAVKVSTDIHLEKLEQLSLRRIEGWLNDRNIKRDIEMDDRHLHGALLISDGSVIMFVDDSESEVEQRFTVAHEVSHYLLDYQIPRERAILEFGPEIMQVLNGNLEATRSQRLRSLLKGVHIKPYTLLLEKTGSGSSENWDVFHAENEADSLALELLAPRARIISETVAAVRRLTYKQFCQKSEEILLGKYRIPEVIARQYASVLAYAVTGGPSFLDRLGF